MHHKDPITAASAGAFKFNSISGGKKKIQNPHHTLAELERNTTKIFVESNLNSCIFPGTTE